MLFLQVCEKHFVTLCQMYFHLKNKGDHSVICSRLLIITITTRTHNVFRLLRPRKMSPGSEESRLMSRNLIVNQRNILKNINNLIHCPQNFALDHLLLFQITRNLAPSIGKRTSCQITMVFFNYVLKLFKAPSIRQGTKWQITKGFLQLFLETLQRP